MLELIHSFLVLARGNVIYHGSYASMPGYFEEFGRHVPDDVNVLEYTLDAIEELQNSEEGLQPLLTFAVSRLTSERVEVSTGSLGAWHCTKRALSILN